MSLHQGHSQADVHLRVASHLRPSPLSWTTPINLERCLKAHSVEQALKTAKDLWRSTSCDTEITALLHSIEQRVQAEHNAFFMCDKFEKPLWVELLPAKGPDSDAFDEELYNEFS